METAKSSKRTIYRNSIRCAVKDCESHWNKDLHVNYHNFPVAGKRILYRKTEYGKMIKLEKFKAWMKAVNVKRVTSTMRVCSLHFHDDDYILPKPTMKRRYLKNIAVPSINLTYLENSAREDQIERARREKLRENVKASENFQVVDLEQDEDDSMESSKEFDDPLATDEQSSSSSSDRLTTEKCSIRFQNDFPKPKLIYFITSERQLKALTGIESYAIFDTIVEIVTNMFGNQLEHPDTEMTIRDKVLMCYAKLRQNMTFNSLAILSQDCSAEMCQRIFFDMIKALSTCLKSVIKWPTRVAISKNLPECFKGFEDVRVVLDCTKVFLVEPHRLRCQMADYHTFLKTRSCKFVTGLTPTGNISYISKVYGGLSRDSAMLSHSGLMDLLQPADAIMINRGFNVDEDCISNKWKCYRLPFGIVKSQYPNAEAKLTSKLDKARVHVERTNRRIKRFKIIGEIIPVSLIPIIQDIVTVICATVNLSSPIRKAKKE